MPALGISGHCRPVKAIRNGDIDGNDATERANMATDGGGDDAAEML